nr:MAG TPA: hypothetical protein [Caudoviricetes sp.]
MNTCSYIIELSCEHMFTCSCSHFQVLPVLA